MGSNRKKKKRAGNLPLAGWRTGIPVLPTARSVGLAGLALSEVIRATRAKEGRTCADRGSGAGQEHLAKPHSGCFAVLFFAWAFFSFP